jgi:hypothetical protein
VQQKLERNSYAPLVITLRQVIHAVDLVKGFILVDLQNIIQTLQIMQVSLIFYLSMIIILGHTSILTPSESPSISNQIISQPENRSIIPSNTATAPSNTANLTHLSFGGNPHLAAKLNNEWEIQQKVSYII